ncbi:hypothetical protein JN00_0552 [Metamycoplasma subdolum]|uniref:Lipoprotein n=1 Tax=Metamycoplasma subdolum TaxID=92407 RepID=A0A3M0AE56_9BACT|nr:hypothetical protein [Metamycoplasma subdolum]RMA77442.1 hypothetical protein JN00_0552 [Metamycoplasma subdolum]WPB50329.1 hypothetical protein R9C05_01835 [Metamycoplasma subdolum]
MKKHWNLLFLNSLILLPAPLIAASCNKKDNSEQKLEIAKNVIADKIFEYKLTKTKIITNNKNVENFTFQFAVGKFEKLKARYSDYLIFDVFPFHKIKAGEIKQNYHEIKKDFVAAIILSKEAAKQIGIINDIGPDWKEQLKSLKIGKLHTAKYRHWDFSEEKQKLTFYNNSYIVYKKDEKIEFRFSDISFLLNKNISEKLNFRVDLVFSDDNNNVSYSHLCYDINLENIIE